jgi:hypothetical protein
VTLYPRITFLDPADEVISRVKNELAKTGLLSTENGSIRVLTTVDKEEKLKPLDFKNTLSILGLDTEIEVVNI